MPVLDLHTKPFDKGTLAKLEIFEDYAEAWLPTFVMQSAPEIHIFDFFSGPGYDYNGIPGSPIRFLEVMNKFLGNIFQSKSKLVLHLNEFEPQKKEQTKYKLLQENCLQFLDDHPKLKHFLTINFYNCDASGLFFELLPIIKKYPALVYLDQNGVKFIGDQYLKEIEKLKTTDILLFVSSAYFLRYGSTDEFQRVLNIGTGEEINSKTIHRHVSNKLKAKLAPTSDLKLFPFSIKKGANIYGIIFGATHFRAVDKFLEISWEKNKDNGEANFDIDGDQAKLQIPLFSAPKLTKVEKFKSDLENEILSGRIANNRDALVFTYETGNYYRYANEVVKGLKKRKIVDYEGLTPAIRYEYVFKNGKQRIVEFKVRR